MLNTTLQNFMPKRYLQNTDGAFSLAWSISLGITLFAVGATFDIAQLSRAKLKSQNLADSIALAGAIYVKNHAGKDPSSNASNDDGATKDDAFYEGVVYTASDAGYNFSNMVHGGSDGVEFTIDYDEEKKQAVVLVQGNVVPGFMQILGKSALPFRAQSVVDYYEEQLTNPASVFLVLDNSGSMAFMDKPNSPNTSSGTKPSDAVARITGLKASVVNFMEQLEVLNSAERSTSPKIVRTAMYPYASAGFYKRNIEANWGTISSGDINGMDANGGTAPQDALVKAELRLKKSNSSLSETKIHNDEHGLGDPLRFLIYMTDGQNNGVLNKWVARDDADYWRKWETFTETRYRTEWKLETETVKGECIWYHYDKKGRFRDHGNKQKHSYDTYYCYPDYQQANWVQVQVPYEHTETGWRYHSGTTAPDNSGWEEGVYDSAENEVVRQTCKRMAEDGVEIFTVAYSLDAGWYNTGTWGYGGSYETSESASRVAKLLMKDCATSNENFLDAVDTSALNQAFTAIGEKITAESIRIRS